MAIELRKDITKLINSVKKTPLNAPYVDPEKLADLALELCSNVVPFSWEDPIFYDMDVYNKTFTKNEVEVILDRIRTRIRVG